jgi:hypothetical protein
MPSTYSARLRVELQATGENPNTWGEKANTVFARIEEAITGFVSIHAGTSVSAPLSLTYANGTADQARYAYLHVTGQLASAIPIHVSAAQKGYWINDETTGQDLLFGVVGKTPVTLAPGWNHVITDGSLSWVAAQEPTPAISAMTEVSADFKYAHKTSANVFTAQNSFQSSVVVSGAAVFTSLLAQTGPITTPPHFDIYTTQPAFASATCGGIQFTAQDLVGTKVTAAAMRILIESAAATSVQSRLDFLTKTSNAPMATVFHMGRGLYAVSASGGDMGPGSGNFDSLFVEGAPVLTSATTPNILQVGTTLTLDPIAIDTKTTQAHGLAAAPTLFETFLENKTAELGFTAGQRIALHGSVFITNGVNVGIQVWSDATNTYLAIANNGLPSFVNGTSDPPGAVTAITAANWLIRVIPIRRT